MLRDLDWAKATNYIAYGIIGLGFLALYLGWNGAASVDCVACQIPYLLSGGAIGIGLIVVGVGVLFVQTTRRNRAELEERVDSIREALEHVGAVRPAAGDATIEIPAASGQVVAGASSYHLPTCHLVEGREDIELLTIDEAEEEGLSACRICKP